MSQRHPAAALGALALVVLLAGGRAAGVPAAPAPSPTTSSTSADAAFLARVESAARTRRTTLRHLEADVVVRIEAPLWSGTGMCEGRLVARRPGALRLRGYAAVATVFDAVTDGERFAVHLPGPDLLWVGPAGRESDLIGMPVDPGTIVGALFGEPYGARGAARAIPGAAGWVAYDQADGAEVRARWAGSPLRIEEAELWSGGERTARLHYRDWRKRKGVWWPTRIDFDGGPDRGSLGLEFAEVRFDHVPPDAAFDPPVAPDATVVDLDGLAPGVR